MIENKYCLGYNTFFSNAGYGISLKYSVLCSAYVESETQPPTPKKGTMAPIPSSYPNFTQTETDLIFSGAVSFRLQIAPRALRTISKSQESHQNCADSCCEDTR